MNTLCLSVSILCNYDLLNLMSSTFRAELTDCQRRLNKATEELANSKLESEQLRNSSAGMYT